MRSREMFFSPWQAADYTGLKVEAIYELLASGEIAGEQVDGRWRLRKSVLDAWLDAEVSPEELENDHQDESTSPRSRHARCWSRPRPSHDPDAPATT